MKIKFYDTIDSYRPPHKKQVIYITSSSGSKAGYYETLEKQWYATEVYRTCIEKEKVLKWSYLPIEENEESKEEKKNKTAVDQAMEIMIQMDKLKDNCATNLDFDKMRKVSRAYTYMSKIFIKEIIMKAREVL